MTELTDAEIEAALAGEAIAGPRTFRGRTLAKPVRGLRAIRDKILRPGDTNDFFDFAFLHILAEAYTAHPAQLLATRSRLLAAADRSQEFRGAISLQLDDATAEDLAEADRLVDEFMRLEKLAAVKVTDTDGKKKDGPAGSPLTSMLSTSGSSPLPPDGASTTSAGS